MLTLRENGMGQAMEILAGKVKVLGVYHKSKRKPLRDKEESRCRFIHTY
jgi:hypothetical protein